MTDHVIIAIAMTACLYVGQSMLRRAFACWYDWNLRRQFFLDGSTEPTSIADYLIQREKARVRYRTTDHYARALERQQWERAHGGALFDESVDLESGLR